jgi:hypothetical protein
MRAKVKAKAKAEASSRSCVTADFGAQVDIGVNQNLDYVYCCFGQNARDNIDRCPRGHVLHSYPEGVCYNWRIIAGNTWRLFYFPFDPALHTVPTGDSEFTHFNDLVLSVNDMWACTGECSDFLWEARGLGSDKPTYGVHFFWDDYTLKDERDRDHPNSIGVNVCPTDWRPYNRHVDIKQVPMSESVWRKAWPIRFGQRATWKVSRKIREFYDDLYDLDNGVSDGGSDDDPISSHSPSATPSEAAEWEEVDECMRETDAHMARKSGYYCAGGSSSPTSDVGEDFFDDDDWA